MNYRSCRLLAMWSPLAPHVAPETSWRLRTRRETKGRTDFTEGPPPGGVAPSAPQPQNPRESNHGETGKDHPFWDLKRAMLERPNHGGFGGQFMEVWARFMEVWIHGYFEFGAPETAPPPWTGTHTLAAWDLENPKD